MKIVRQTWALSLLLLAAGCTTPTGTFLDGPSILPGSLAPGQEEPNPLFAPFQKDKVFETVLQVLGDFGFEIADSNRADLRIETVPRTAPGLVLFLKSGSPDLYERTLSTLQSYRHRVTVLIHPSAQGGFFIEVQARKELEDLPRPVRSTIGNAIFRTDNNIDRQFEVIDDTTPGTGWIYKGRDPALEQELIHRIKATF